MTSVGSDVLVEIAHLALYALLATAFTVGGLLAEYVSLQHLGSDPLLALWFAALGGVLLYAGLYGVGYRKVVARG